MQPSNKLTEKSFLEKYKERNGKECPFDILKFNGSVKPSEFHHAECGYTWKSPARGMFRTKSPTGCPRCSGVEKYNSSEEWMAGYKRHTGDEFPYEFIQPYSGARVPTEFHHKICGYRWKTAPQNFRKGSGCPRCAKSERYNNFSEWGDSYRRRYGKDCPYHAIEPFKGVCINVMFFHPECGHTWSARPANIMTGKGCPKCAAESAARSLRYESFEEFKLAAKVRRPDLKIDEFELIGEFTGVNDKSLVRHTPCGYEFEPFMQNLSKGQGCPRCSRTEIYKDAENWMHVYRLRHPKSKIEMTGEYVNSVEKAKFRCEKGHEWDSATGSIMQGGGCPHCAGSGFSSAKPGNLYYIKHFDDSANKHFYKIGITNREVMERFKGTKVDAEKVKQWRFENGQEARDRENEILKKHSSDRISSYCLGKGNGHTEWFRRDVLGLF